MTDENGLMVTAHTKYGDILVFRKEKYGKSFASKVSKLDYERPVFDRLIKGGYDIFIDIGASFGIHTVVASHFAKKVVAIEAQPLLAGFLKWNTRNLDNVFAFDYFVGYNNEPTLFGNPHGMVGKAGKFRQEKLNKATVIPLIEILSEFADEKKVLVKIDTEGNEEDILKSSGNLRHTMNNLEFIIELHPWASTEESLSSCLPEYKYRKIHSGKKSAVYNFWRD